MAEKITWTNERRTLAQLKPWERNPRQITRDQAKRLAESFDQFGQVETIAVGPGNEVYNGHQRLSVLMDKHGSGYEVEVRVASRALTEKEREKLTVFLHKGAAGEWDFDALSEWDVPDLVEWGFEPEELGITVDEPVGEDPGAQIDKAEGLREKWGVESGQLWRLGEHRLICGDCTDRQVVERVMGGEKAQGIITSPPYAEQRKDTYGGVPMEGYVDWWNGIQEIADIVLCDGGNFFVNIKPHCDDGQRVLYVFDLVLSMVRNWGWKLIDELCWVRQSMPNGTEYRLKNEFEPVYHFCKTRPIANLSSLKDIASTMTKPKRYRKSGSGSGLHNFDYEPEEGALPGNVLMINTGEVNMGTQNHPATFPVRLPEFFITGFSQPRDIWFEHFSGSGTTLIACERLGRKCRAVEISPAYCAVTIQRWVDMTGGVPELL